MFKRVYIHPKDTRVMKIFHLTFPTYLPYYYDCAALSLILVNTDCTCCKEVHSIMQICS